jgi:hypothetical protein
VPVIQPSCESMNPVNSGSVLATTGRVHTTTGRVHATIGRVSEMIGRVLETISRVPGTVSRRGVRLPWSIIHVSRLIAPNLLPQTCFTDESDMSDGPRLDNLS